MTLNDITWHVHEGGVAHALPALFLHGFMGQGGVWLPTINQLQDRIQGVALDLPGHGRTTANLEKLDFDPLADAIAAFAIRHFERPPLLIGYSMGGRIALHTALRYPDQFAGLVLESTTAGIEDRDERARRRDLDRRRGEDLVKRGMEAFLEGWYTQPIYASLADRPELIESILHKKADNDPARLAAVMERLSPGRQPSLWHLLPLWRKPALIVAGERDEKYTAAARRMAQLIDGSILRIIPGAGHIVHLENHPEFMAALNLFLSSYRL
jgi:2-succinyl-6-hydroxy-2,4-cyclohexadiene-1-carboxylate synthase